MTCLCREGEKRCGWWIPNGFSNESNGYCINPHIEIQTKSICSGTQKRLSVKRQGSYPQGTQSGALVY
jgi:hypothetical protein